MHSAPSDASLDTQELADLRSLCTLMIPASSEFGVPGADDAAIFADIGASLGRDTAAVKTALACLAQLAGGGFAGLDPTRQTQVAEEFRTRHAGQAMVLVNVVARCYYRDDRVMRSLGMEVRAPFPKGFKVDGDDWSLLEPVRAGAKRYRDAP